MRKNSQDAVQEFRPYFDNAPVYGHGPSLEDFTEMTPLTVGSPAEVIEKTLKFRDYFGDYQRQLFLMDHAGLPLKTVLEQLDLLGEEVIPTLRKEFDALRPAHVPEAPTHAESEGRRAGRPRRRGDRTGECRDPVMTPFTIAVISAGLSQPSSTRLLADQLAEAARREAAHRGRQVQTVNVELRELAHDITNNLLTGFPAPALQQAIDQVTSADAVIAVTPVFSASYSGLFKSFFDVLDPQSLVGKPGADGGDRRVRPALAGAGLRAATAVLLPQGDPGLHRGVRRDRRFRFGRGRPVTGRPDPPRRRRTGRFAGTWLAPSILVRTTPASARDRPSRAARSPSPTRSTNSFPSPNSLPAEASVTPTPSRARWPR